MYDSQNLSINFSATFGIWVCHISLPKLGTDLVVKKNPKIFGFENVLQKRNRTPLVFVRLKIESMIFEKVLSKH